MTRESAEGMASFAVAVAAGVDVGGAWGTAGVSASRGAADRRTKLKTGMEEVFIYSL